MWSCLKTHQDPSCEKYCEADVVRRMSRLYAPKEEEDEPCQSYRTK